VSETVVQSRTAWQAFGIAVTVAVLLGAGSVAWRTWLSPERTVEHRQTYRQPVSRVEFISDVGDLTVLAGEPGAVTVERQLTSTSRNRPTVDEALTGQTLQITGRCPSNGWRFGLGSECRIHYVLLVPPDTSLEVRTDAGDVRVKDLTGEVRITVAAGDVTAEHLAGPLLVRSDSGDIRGIGLRTATTDLETSAGDIDLSFAQTPATVSVVADAGDVVIGLPDGTYRVSTDADAGEEEIDVANDPGARSTVTARTSAGDITVRYAD
jgi:hypothetical protein